MKVVIHFDGSCYPNPGGKMGCGIVIERFGGSKVPYIKHTCHFEKIAQKSNSNNVAEYMALGYALLIVNQLYPNSEHLTIIGDSNLVIQQMSGKWRIKQGDYVDEAYRCKAMLAQISKTTEVEYQWVPRDQNKEADSHSR